MKQDTVPGLVLGHQPRPDLRPDAASSSVSLPDYSVLIRTFNSEKTLPETLTSIERQSRPPVEYIVVDSGSTDRTTAILPRNSTVAPYQGKEFNYSDALNQGVKHVTTNYVLIISSHTVLLHEGAVAFTLSLLESTPSIGAAYFSQDQVSDLRYETIGRREFNGFNGLWNTCSLVRTELLRKRPFRPEVFAAEDQEWASWLIRHEGMMTARILGSGSENRNARKYDMAKLLNDYIAIAYYADRSLLSLRSIARIGLKVVTLTRNRYFHLVLFCHLLSCRFRRPARKSRY